MKKQPAPPTLVLYHGNCQDGFMACYVAYLALAHTREDIAYQAVNYGEPVPDLTGKEVFILDFSYKPALLIEAAKTAHSVIMLDHHKTAMEDWEGYNSIMPGGVEAYEAGTPLPLDNLRSLSDRQNENLQVTIRMNQSGAGLAWDHFDRELLTNKRLGPEKFKAVGAMVRAVEDRDLWLFKRQHTKALCATLSVVPKTFDAYDTFFCFTHPEDVLKQGEGILKHSEQLAASIASRAQEAMFEGHKVGVVNCNKEHTSLVGNALCERYPFAVLYEIMGLNLNVSMRSTDQSVDVSAIARKHGGGGHRNAAGFIVPLHDFLPPLFTSPVPQD